MIQLYFLSVLCNSAAAYILILGETGQGDTIESSLKFSLHNKTFRLILGILCAVIGLLKLLSPSFDNIPVLGDLLPALAGLTAGFVLVFGYYQEHASVGGFEAEGKIDRVGETFLKYKKAVGFVLFASAALHFLFPQALFL